MNGQAAAGATAVGTSATVDERTVTVRDVELSVAEAGRGGRPLLLVHGFTGAKEDFSEWLEPLAARGWHAVAPDLRGHGASAQPAADDAYTFTLFAEDVVGLADAMGWDSFCLLGHSMGGMVAQVVATTWPSRVRALVLMDTGHGPVEGLDPDLVAAAVGIVRDQGMGALVAVMADRTSPLDTPAHQRLLAEKPGYAAFEERKMRASSPHLYCSMAVRFLDAADRLDDLRSLPATLPVLVMVGEQDAPFLAPSQRMAKAIAGAALVVIPDAGHSPQFENPDAWWTVLTGFLDRLS